MKKFIYGLVALVALGLLLQVTNNSNIVAKEPAALGKVAAKVNEKELATSDLIKRLLSKHGKAVLENMIQEEIVTLELEKRKLTPVTEKEIDLYIKRIVKQLQLTQGGLANINSFLKNLNMTKSDFRIKVRREIGIQRILGDSIIVTDKEMQEHYDKFKSIYVEPPAKQVINITIFHRNSPAPSDMRNDISKAEAFKLAQEVQALWQKDDKYIDALWETKKYFIRGYKKRFGVPVKLKDKKHFVDVFKTAPNKITPVIEDNNGFQIYKVLNDLAGRTVPFKEVKSNIHDTIKASKVRKSLQAGVFDKIKEKYKVQRFLNLKAEK